MFGNGQLKILRDAVSLVNEPKLVLLIHPDFLLMALEEFSDEVACRQEVFNDSPINALGDDLGAFIEVTGTKKLIEGREDKLALLKQIEPNGEVAQQ